MATTVTNKQQKHTLSAKKRNSLKTVLRSPYSEPNPVLDNKDDTILLEKLRKTIKKSIPKGCKISQLKDQFAFGVNETTKCLERDKLKLVLCSRSSHVITKHLFQLAGVRKCPLIVVSNLDSFCKSLAHLNRLSCLGFLKDAPQNQWTDFVDFAKKCAPTIDLPWLDFENTVLEQLNDPSEIIEDIARENEDMAGDVLVAEDEHEESVKDFSYLYNYKALPEETRGPADVEQKSEQNKPDDFGSAFLAFGSDSDDDLEEFVSQSGRIKLFPKKDPPAEVAANTLPQKRRFHVLGLDQKSSRKKKNKAKTQRFFIENSSGGTQKDSMQYKTAHLEKMQPNEKRKKKSKR